MTVGSITQAMLCFHAPFRSKTLAFYMIPPFSQQSEKIAAAFITKEPLINCLRGMKRKAHGAQEPRHI